MNIATQIISRYEEFCHEHDSITEANEAFFEALDDDCSCFTGTTWDFSDGSRLYLLNDRLVVGVVL